MDVDLYEMRIMRMTPEQANAHTQNVSAWCADNQSHLPIRDAMEYWRKAHWDLMFHRNYGPNAGLLREIDQYRELNLKQAARIMELEFENRSLRRVHDHKIRGD